MSYVNSNGTEIYYESTGTGPAILFAHGAGGNAAIWFNQIGYFKSKHQCITFDHRSFARSPAPDSSLTIPNFRDDIFKIMDNLGIDEAHMVGQSMGGFSTLRCALDSPDRVSSLTLSCTPGGIPLKNPSKALQELGSRGVDGIKATMSKRTFKDASLVQLYSSIQAFNTEFSFSRLSNLSRLEDQVDKSRLKNMKVPVLLVSGEEDPLFLPEQLSELVPYFHDARIEFVANAGHSPYFEQPDIFNKLLQEHIGTCSK